MVTVARAIKELRAGRKDSGMMKCTDAEYTEIIDLAIVALKTLAPDIALVKGNQKGRDPGVKTGPQRRSFTAPKAQAQCDEWNRQYPVGTEVIRTDDSGVEHLTKTRERAWVLPSKVAVILVDGVTGCYLLDRIRPRKCRLCGCTTNRPCIVPSQEFPGGITGCHWVEADLCSACVRKEDWKKAVDLLTQPYRNMKGEVSISVEWVKTTCRPGAGANSCICLVVGQRGFECNFEHMDMKNLVGESLHERWKRGATVAKRYGCDQVKKLCQKADLG